jgi:hypothetical protein
VSTELDLGALRAHAHELRDWYFDIDEGDDSIYATNSGPHDHPLAEMRRKPKEAVCAALNAFPALLAAAGERDALASVRDAQINVIEIVRADLERTLAQTAALQAEVERLRAVLMRAGSTLDYINDPHALSPSDSNRVDDSLRVIRAALAPAAAKEVR